MGARERAEVWKLRIEEAAIRVHIFELLIEVRATRGREWRGIFAVLRGKAGSVHMCREG